MTIKRELAEYINKWIELSLKQHEVTKYLYNHTELFEQKYEHDFKNETFRFFAGKITRSTTDINKLINTLTKEDEEILAKEKIRRI